MWPELCLCVLFSIAFQNFPLHIPSVAFRYACNTYEEHYHHWITCLLLPLNNLSCAGASFCSSCSPGYFVGSVGELIRVWVRTHFNPRWEFIHVYLSRIIVKQQIDYQRRWSVWQDFRGKIVTVGTLSVWVFHGCIYLTCAIWFFGKLGCVLNVSEHFALVS